VRRLRQRFGIRPSKVATTTWLLVTLGFVAAALLPGTSGAVPSIEIPGRLELRTAVPNPSLPNDPDRCAALIFVEFAEVPDATGYRAEVIRTSNGNLEAYSVPLWSDAYRLSWGGTNVSTLDIPDGLRWIGPLSEYTTGFGCSDARTAVDGAWELVRVQAFFDGNMAPVATFTPDADGLTVAFDASGSRDQDGQVAGYSWDFGDDHTGSDQKTSHRYDSPGSYRVKLTVEDDDGAKDDFWLTVDVAGGGLVVNSAGDLPDQIGSDETCDTGGTIVRGGKEEPECTLRAAIKESERRTGADEITFAIVGTPVIPLTSKLPSVVGPVKVDGASQGPNSTCTTFPACVRIESTLTDPVLDISGREVTISGLDLKPSASPSIRIGAGGGHVIEGNALFLASQSALAVPGLEIVGADGVQVDDNVIGSAGGFDVRIAAASNVSLTGNQLNGLGALVSGSSFIDIGAQSSTPGQAPGNDIATIRIDGSTSVSVRGNTVESVEVDGGSNNHLEGNDVGTVKIAEATSGIRVGGQTSVAGQFPGNRITTALELRGDQNFVQGNLIEGAPRVGCRGIAGVDVHGSGNVFGGDSPGASNTVRGWTIGVKVNGFTQVRGNLIEHNGTGIDVGGSGPQECTLPAPPSDDTLIAGNTISNNGLGIDVSSNSTGTRVEGNRIGTTADGTAAAPNSIGVQVSGPAVIGGTSTAVCATPCNVISGNEHDGISVFQDLGLFGTNVSTIKIQGNMIGTTPDGSTPMPNGESGVDVIVGRKVLIGGSGLGEGNVIARNGAHGVAVSTGLQGQDNVANTIRGNRIFANGRLGIDLDADGVTANDFADADGGTNDRQNFPEWRDADVIAGQLRIHGRIPIHATVQGTYIVDLYVSDDCDPLFHGEGQVPYASLTTTDFDDGSFQLDIPPGILSDRVLTATATAPDGSTSEFSSCLDATAISQGAVLTAQAPAGSTQLAVDSPSGLVGKVVALGSGPTFELNFGSGMAPLMQSSASSGAAAGSLILARPTRFAHPAGQPVVALDDTLFVSIDKAVITRSSKLPDIALVSGRLRAVEGRSIACGDDVTLSLDGATVAQRVPGTKFVRQSGNRCVFAAKTENGIGRLELDLGKGTWNAQIIRRDLEKLTNPVIVGLAIGNDSGSEELRFRIVGPVWTYSR
jgi:PKD repeat protein